MYMQTSLTLSAMPRPLENNINQEQNPQTIRNMIDATRSKLVPIESEKLVLSRANSSVSLIGSGNSTALEDMGIENLGVKINEAIEPLKEKISELTDKLAEQNEQFNNLLTEQRHLIEKLIINNRELEEKLEVQERNFDEQLAKRLAAEKEASNKQIADLQQQIRIKLEQQQTDLTTELTTQTGRINISHTSLQIETNDFKSRTTETEQKHYQEMLTLFRGLQTEVTTWEQKLQLQANTCSNLESSINDVSRKLNGHVHRYKVDRYDNSMDRDYSYLTPTLGPDFS